jgi:capsular exopolysaccharide synthesis family protein
VDVGEHFRTILRGWWRILLAAALVSVGVYFARKQAPAEYEAGAVVQVVSGASLVGLGSAAQTQYTTDTYAALGNTSSIITQAIHLQNLHVDLETARKHLSVETAGLGMILIKSTGPDVHEAVGLGQGVLDALVNEARNQQLGMLHGDVAQAVADRARINTQLATIPPSSPIAANLRAQLNAASDALSRRAALPSNQVLAVSPAGSNGKPISPIPSRDAQFTFIVALAVVAELWVWRATRADRFSSLDESEMMRDLGLPVLARVPKGNESETLESLRTLRTNLMFLSGAAKPRTVAVVSANAEAGKTFVAVQLAEAAAAVDEQVVLVDADLRRPVLHDRLGLRRAPGLTAVLQGADVAGALRRVRTGNSLRVLPSGSSSSDPSALLGARAFRSVLEQLRSMRLVVVDTAPVALFADAVAVASQCDATIFVLDMKTSRKRAVRTAIETLRRGGANVVGVVVNRDAVPRSVMDIAA